MIRVFTSTVLGPANYGCEALGGSDTAAADALVLCAEACGG